MGLGGITVEREIDHEYTDEVVCPFCGYEESDSWEYKGDEDLTGEV